MKCSIDRKFHMKESLIPSLALISENLFPCEFMITQIYIEDLAAVWVKEIFKHYIHEIPLLAIDFLP